MKIAALVLSVVLLSGCATERKPLTSQEQAAGQVEVLTSRRDGASFYR